MNTQITMKHISVLQSVDANLEVHTKRMNTTKLSGSSICIYIAGNMHVKGV